MAANAWIAASRPSAHLVQRVDERRHGVLADPDQRGRARALVVPSEARSTATRSARRARASGPIRPSAAAAATRAPGFALRNFRSGSTAALASGPACPRETTAAMRVPRSESFSRARSGSMASGAGPDLAHGEGGRPADPGLPVVEQAHERGGCFPGVRPDAAEGRRRSGPHGRVLVLQSGGQRLHRILADGGQRQDSGVANRVVLVRQGRDQRARRRLSPSARTRPARRPHRGGRRRPCPSAARPTHRASCRCKPAPSRPAPTGRRTARAEAAPGRTPPASGFAWRSSRLSRSNPPRLYTKA